MQYPWGKGTPKWTLDATANDSDKSFTVPAGKVWDLRSVEVDFLATATVGNRSVRMAISNGAAFVHQSIAVVAAASASAVLFIGVGVNGSSTGRPRVVGGGSATATVNDSLQPMLLPAGYIVRVYDVSAVDVAADDMTVVLHYVEYDA